MIVWNSADRLIRQAKIAYRMWLALHPSVEKGLQLKYDSLFAEKRYDRASCHEVGTTTRYRVGFLIADCQLLICYWRLADKAIWQCEIENRKSGDPPATAWWYGPRKPQLERSS
jgi:hypothetical protein